MIKTSDFENQVVGSIAGPLWGDKKGKMGELEEEDQQVRENLLVGRQGANRPANNLRKSQQSAQSPRALVIRNLLDGDFHRKGPCKPLYQN